MTEVGSKVDKGQKVDADSQDYLIEVNLSMDKFFEEETWEEDISEEEVISVEVTDKIS